MVVAVPIHGPGRMSQVPFTRASGAGCQRYTLNLTKIGDVQNDIKAMPEIFARSFSLCGSRMEAMTFHPFDANISRQPDPNLRNCQ